MGMACKMHGIRNVYKMCIWKPEGKRTPKDNIKMGHKNIM
jgi:hypothetical protein